MLCPFCDTNPIVEGQDVCMSCHFTGKEFETYLLNDERSNVLAKIREVPQVASANVWHMGSGAFQLGVMLDDGRIVIPGIAQETQEGMIVIPAVPPMSAKWAVAVTDDQQTGVGIIEGAYDDEELVEVVEKLADGRLEAPLVI